MIKNFFILLAIIFVFITQTSFLSGSIWFGPRVNFILALIVFIALIRGYHQGLVWAVVAGGLMDLYSGWPFGTMILALLLSIILGHYLFKNFLTNRSVYSLTLIIIGTTLSYNFFVVLIINFLHFFNPSNLNLDFNSFFLASVAWQILGNSLLIWLTFFGYNAITKRLEKSFIVRGDFR